MIQFYIIDSIVIKKLLIQTKTEKRGSLLSSTILVMNDLKEFC